MEPNEWTKNKKLVIKNNKLELLKEQVFMEEQTLIQSMNPYEQFDYFLSKLNYIRRKNAVNSLDFNVIIRVGDICFIDYGHSYQQEIGYMHFGLIVAQNRGKVLIVPITGSNTKTVHTFEEGNEHIVQLGKIEGMRKVCACYINDAKWLNSARIIDVKSHIPVDGELFKSIKNKIKESID